MADLNDKRARGKERKEGGGRVGGVGGKRKYFYVATKSSLLII